MHSFTPVPYTTIIVRVELTALPEDFLSFAPFFYQCSLLLMVRLRCARAVWTMICVICSAFI
jgi:hypothetical protein